MRRAPAAAGAALSRPPKKLLWLAALVALAACGGGPEREQRAERVIPAVEAVQARRGSLPLVQRLSGVVEARNQVEIHPEVSAVVTEVLVVDGEAVLERQPLVRLRAADAEKRLSQALANHRIAVAQLRRAEAVAKEAKAEYERLQLLAEQSLASEADLVAGEARAETAEADIELARARVDQAQAVAEEEQENLERTVVRSPIEGVVGGRQVEPGMLVGPSTTLLTLGQLDSVRVEVVLTDRMLADISEGQRTEILLAGNSLSAPLARISPFLNPISHTTRGEIDLANRDRLLKPGMFVTVDVFYGESQEATLIPSSAIYDHPNLGITGVYVAEDGLPEAPTEETKDTRYLSPPVRFRFVPIEILAEGRMEIAVRPVEEGDWVVSLGQNLLGTEEASARVRPVGWQRVEELQTLQREDLMRDLVESPEAAGGS